MITDGKSNINSGAPVNCVEMAKKKNSLIIQFYFLNLLIGFAYFKFPLLIVNWELEILVVFITVYFIIKFYLVRQNPVAIADCDDSVGQKNKLSVSEIFAGIFYGELAIFLYLAIYKMFNIPHLVRASIFSVIMTMIVVSFQGEYQRNRKLVKEANNR